MLPPSASGAQAPAAGMTAAVPPATPAGPLVAVVIPYFQRRPGILLKAVESALAQPVRSIILVVDDASPVPARDELAGLMTAHPGRIVLTEQANGGPAAARNAALDRIPAGVDYIAFLDSDDSWIPSHLPDALAALGQGYDFFFADHYQLNQSVSAFQRAGRIDPARHPALAGAGLHAYRGDMFDQILMGNIIGTSTVVYRHAPFAAQRFRSEFVYAGEDYLFWLELARATDRIAFSTVSACTYGAGVNIFSGSGWGTENSLLRLMYEMKYKQALPRLFPLNAVQHDANRRSVKALRRGFVADVLHRLLHRRPVAGAVLREQWRNDPRTFWYALPLALSIVLQRGAPAEAPKQRVQ